VILIYIPESRAPEPDCREHRLLAEAAASERRLAGIIKLDDRFEAAISPDRLSSLDPERRFEPSIGLP